MTNPDPSLADALSSGSRCRLVELPKFPDPRGSLTFAEGARHVPFVVRRAYWLYDVPGGQIRGGHAYARLEEFFVALSGSFDVAIDDGTATTRVNLRRSYVGLYVPAMHWRQLEKFSTNAVCLILASTKYDEHDYVRDYDNFRALASSSVE